MTIADHHAPLVVQGAPRNAQCRATGKQTSRLVIDASGFDLQAIGRENSALTLVVQGPLELHTNRSLTRQGAASAVVQAATAQNQAITPGEHTLGIIQQTLNVQLQPLIRDDQTSAAVIQHGSGLPAIGLDSNHCQAGRGNFPARVEQGFASDDLQGFSSGNQATLAVIQAFAFQG
nr:hypothetical protein [Pseudomonas argentinensis]